MIARLRLRILEDGRHQYQIATQCGISPSRLSEYCLGHRAIPNHHLRSLCEYFRCGPDEVVGWVDEEEVGAWR